MWRVIYAPFSYALFISLWLPLVLIGHILIPFLIFTVSYDKKYSEKFKHYYLGFPNLFWLWSNEEDGIFGSKEFRARYPTWADGLRGYIWSAWRNPVNNLRFVPYLSCNIDPSKIKFNGSHKDPRLYDQKNLEYWYFCHHGFYTSFRRQYSDGLKMKEFWIGWKLWPSDVFGVEGVRKHGAGFAIQWREYKGIGGDPYVNWTNP